MRKLVTFLLDYYRVSIRRACAVLPFRRQSWDYQPKGRDLIKHNGSLVTSSYSTEKLLC